MDTNNEMAKRVKRIATDMQDLKANQTVGGDSWLVYRYNILYTKKAGSVSKVTFTPEVAGDFVAVAMTWYPDAYEGVFYGSIQDVTPDPNIMGVWYDCTYAYSDVPRAMMIYSTKKGTAVMENLNTAKTA